MLCGTIKASLDKYTSHYSVVKTKEEYLKLEDKHTYDVMAIWGVSPFAGAVVIDQIENNKVLKYVHSLSTGVDGYCSIKSFRDSLIPLTNARGAFAEILAEYVMLGMLYFAKHVPMF